MKIQRLCEHVARLIHTPIRQYDKDGCLQQVFGDFNDLHDFLTDDQIILTKYKDRSHNKQLPMLLSEEGFPFTVAFFDQKNKCDYVLGSVKYLTKMPIKEAVDVETLCKAAGMIYEEIYDQPFSVFDILTADADQEEIQMKLQKQIGRIAFDYQEMGELHNPYEQELREQSSIREGNQEKLFRSFRENYAGRLARLSKDELRSVKNLGIVVLAISTRAAIEGGVHPEQAFILSDSYIMKIDESAEATEIYNIVRGAEVYFTQLVAETRRQKTENPLIIRAEKLIFKSLHNKIKVEDIAKELNTNASYLSASFKKETGVTIHEFIMNEKMKISENLLLYSNYSIEEIANYLGFSSQSHFGNVFKRKFGLTPNKFRSLSSVEKG